MAGVVDEVIVPTEQLLQDVELRRWFFLFGARAGTEEETYFCAKASQQLGHCPSFFAGVRQ